jgi:GNAT superfamily N-acetyltransferase
MEGVRPATGSDVPRLLEMAQELLDGVTAHRGGALLVGSADPPPSPERNRGRLDDLLADQTALVAVGTIDEVVTGFGVCHVEEVGALGLRGVLDACYVEPGARGVGLGRLLLDTAVSWLEARGCRGVDGAALPGDRGAKNFYESAGFKARLLTMYREVG